jgi:NADH-quinone oxidoreductase subunit G
MPKLVIDGRELEAEQGASIIEVASANGIEIPHYCWHPYLSVAANCRMCLVEVEKAPKLLPACEVKVRDGMVVDTRSKLVLEARRSVMEFLLLNHPIDCPICDQAGECKLQDYYMQHDRTGTRFQEVKVPKKKTNVLGPTIVLDEERCINCTRCVRFMNEIAQSPQLGQFDRGDRAVIGVFPGTQLDHPYSANVADICPVGALTNRDFRFKTRSWFLTKTDSVCPGCARGCSTRIDHADNEIKRLKPRDNDFINKSWMCDDGRLTYKRVHHPEKQITSPYVCVDGKLEEIGWAEARQQLAERLGFYVGDSDGGLGLGLSAQITTEGAAAFVEPAEQLLQVDTYSILGLADWDSDDLLKVSDRNPNRAGLELVLEAYSIYDEGAQALRTALEGERVKTLVLVGSEVPEPNEDWIASLQKLEHLIVFTSSWDETSREADLIIPVTSYAEQDGTFLNVDGRMQRLNRALKPIGGRKGLVEAAAFTAAALGAGSEWDIHNWVSSFNRLKKRTNLLQDISPLEIDPLGVSLEEEHPERPSIPAEQASATA